MELLERARFTFYAYSHQRGNNTRIRHGLQMAIRGLQLQLDVARDWEAVGHELREDHGWCIGHTMENVRAAHVKAAADLEWLMRPPTRRTSPCDDDDYLHHIFSMEM